MLFRVLVLSAAMCHAYMPAARNTPHGRAARAIDALQTLRLAMPTFKDALHVAAAELTTTEEGKTLLTCFLEGKKRRKNSKEVPSHPA